MDGSWTVVTLAAVGPARLARGGQPFLLHYSPVLPHYQLVLEDRKGDPANWDFTRGSIATPVHGGIDARSR